MIKKTLTFTDFDGKERTEDFYFNLTKAEVLKMEMGKDGGLAEHIKRIVAAQKQPEIIALFEELVLLSYGIKSADGRRFEKSDAIREEFKQTQAYSDIFMELAFDDVKAAEFVNGIVPADLNVDKAEHPALKAN